MNGFRRSDLKIRFRSRYKIRNKIQIIRTGSIIIKMVKRRVDINNRHITSFFGQGSKSKNITSNKNKPLLMSSHEVDRCNDILKARKSAISRGKDPDDAEQRIRRKY